MGRISVVTNAFIIAFTSEFIPRIVYKYKYSNDSTLNGYLNFTLSYFNPKDLENHNHEDTNMLIPNDIIHPKYCRYRDFRHPPWEAEENVYQETDAFWHVLAARLAFVVAFQNCVALVVMAIKWIVPNLNSDIEDRCRREAYITNEVIIRSELLKSKGVREEGRVIDEMNQNEEASMSTQEFMMKSVEGGSKDRDGEGEMRLRKGTSASKGSVTLTFPGNDFMERTEKKMIGDVTDGNIIV